MKDKKEIEAKAAKQRRFNNKTAKKNKEKIIAAKLNTYYFLKFA